MTKLEGMTKPEARGEASRLTDSSSFELRVSFVFRHFSHLPMTWTRKDLLSIQELSADELTTILDTAAAFKQVGTREIKKVPALRGQTLVNFFVEPSTRTRPSFELP